MQFFLFFQFMLSSEKIDHLIVQTNYLSTMFQRYHELLLNKKYKSKEENSPHEAESQVEGPLESSESDNRNRDQVIHDNDQQFSLASPHLNSYPFQEDISEHQIQDRPTGYTREDSGQKIMENIQQAQRSIGFCFQALQQQIKIKKDLKEITKLHQEQKDRTLNSRFDFDNKDSLFGYSRRSQKLQQDKYE